MYMRNRMVGVRRLSRDDCIVPGYLRSRILSRSSKISSRDVKLERLLLLKRDLLLLRRIKR